MRFLKVSLSISILFLMLVLSGCNPDNSGKGSDNDSSNVDSTVEAILEPNPFPGPSGEPIQQKFEGTRDKAIMADPVVRKDYRPNEDKWGKGEICKTLRTILEAREAGFVSLAEPGDYDGYLRVKKNYLLGAEKGVISPEYSEFHLKYIAADKEYARKKFEEWSLEIMNCTPGNMSGIYYEEDADGFWSGLRFYTLFEDPGVDGRIRVGLGATENSWIVEMTIGK